MLKTTLSKCGCLVVVFALSQGLKTSTYIGAPKYDIQKEGSEIRFQVKSRLKIIEGVFETWKAEIDLDPTRLEGLHLGVQAQSASIKTGNLLEETLIRSENFFAAEKYPEVSVVSKKVSVEGTGRFRMDADLKLRDTSHPVVIPFVLELGAGHEGKLRGEFEFNRKDFGMTYNMTLNPIEDVVKVIVTLKVREQGTEAKSPPPANN
jgi:polyisoprenoid-binding protein YceI